MFKSTPALLVIDVQEAIDKFSEHKRGNSDAEDIIAALLSFWRSRCLPVVHIRHASKFEASPYHISSNYFSFKHQVAPMEGEKVITKHENCAFINTDLEPYLKGLGISEIVVCGVLTNHSIDATVRVASGLGFQVFVPHDATAAFGLDLMNGTSLSADDVQTIFLSNLNNEYCTVCVSSDLIKN